MGGLVEAISGFSAFIRAISALSSSRSARFTHRPGSAGSAERWAVSANGTALDLTIVPPCLQIAGFGFNPLSDSLPNQG
jgi:hypothetical protein